MNAHQQEVPRQGAQQETNRPPAAAFILHNRQLAPNLYEMECAAPAIAAQAQPGQFVMLAVEDEPGLFLRRPFGIAGIQPEKGQLRIYYQTIGRGTRRMSSWTSGRLLDLLGPLGRGFRWQDGPGRALLVGGGMGIAPLLPLAQALRRSGQEVTAFLGAASFDRLFSLGQLGEEGCQVRIATEDGSAGFAGLVTAPLAQYLADATTPGNSSAADTPITSLYACGPTPLLQAVAALARSHALPLQLSLEERMGCGLGACMGCTVQTRDAQGNEGQSRVCYEGPVFAGEEVIFHG